MPDRNGAGGQTESPFKHFVVQWIESIGYKAVAQVGVSISTDSIVSGERITPGTPLALMLPPMQHSYLDCEAVVAELTANRFEIKARS
ncbi:hypothetical protein [Paracoccus yeei]|uniref:Uncharacterized protein n=1 Tax=Paracoccus yeei TaxID=147645 RepID=A0A2D2C748_9RHOB|nr:hypothetical protein [Paracoccus yeei]ATQ58297.1 hypothetical protein PYTT13_20950 [Paracoccus yeei]